MSNHLSAQQINAQYLDMMYNASGKNNKTLQRIRSLWWPSFISDYENRGDECLDSLDSYMEESRSALQLLAHSYANENADSSDPDRRRLLASQFLKSNTGKMFERFIGLCISHSLLMNQSQYSIWPFRADISKVCSYLRTNHFHVGCKLGSREFTTPIDCDLIVFNPLDNSADFYMLSIKSTLKDRFHNVPFWNLMRVCALNDLHSIYADTEIKKLLSRAKYVAACTDLAEEQPDFSNATGPRNLLCLDAALLDGAYVTSSKAVGLGEDDNHFGAHRTAPFYPLTKFTSMMQSS